MRETYNKIHRWIRNDRNLRTTTIVILSFICIAEAKSIITLISYFARPFEAMPGITQVIIPFLMHYKYVAIFCITFIAALAFPIPPGTLLMASSAFAEQGYLNFGLIILFGTLGNVAGDNLGYWLARIYGKDVLVRLGFGKILDSKKFKGVERRIKERPGFFIFITRFEVFSNLASNLICGLSKVSYGRYLVFEILGELAQVTIYCSLGYFLGDNWPVISKFINRSLLLILLIIALLCAIFWKRIGRWIDKE